MAKLTRDEFISSLKEMSILEIKELVDAMKEEFGVDPSAVAVAGPVAAAVEEGPSKVNVVLTAAGANKIAVIKLVRDITGLGLMEAKALADSILNVVKKDSSKIETLAKSLSDDPSAQTNNGDLGWFTDGMMVHNFNEFVQDNKVGTVGMVETPFGYHIIKVTDRKAAEPKARLAVVAHEITPSTATYQNVFAEANRFVTENTTAEAFNKAIEEQGLNKRTYPNLRTNTNYITGITNPRQIVRWAFDKETKVGDMSSIFDLDNMYVVAVLTKSVKEGYTPAEDIMSLPLRPRKNSPRAIRGET